jgi:hypothetical protein
MAIYKDEKPETSTRPAKRPINVHMENHARYFRLLELHRQRESKPSMPAEDFLVDLMNMYEGQLEKEAAGIEP